MTSRLTLNSASASTATAASCPSRKARSGGRFTAATPTHYDEVSDVKTFNHPVPRIGLIFDVTGAGPHRHQGQLRQVLLEPGHRHRRTT